MPRTDQGDRRNLCNFESGDVVRIVGTDIIVIVLADRGERTELEGPDCAFSCLCVDDNWTLRRIDGGAKCEKIEKGDRWPWFSGYD